MTCKALSRRADGYPGERPFPRVCVPVAARVAAPLRG